MAPDEEVPESHSDAESCGLLLVARAAVRRSVLGVHDAQEGSSRLSATMLSALERVASYRARGVPQADLANAMGVKHSNFFYVATQLTARGLASKLPFVANGSGGRKGGPPKHTSVLHLRRFAPAVRLGHGTALREVRGGGVAPRLVAGDSGTGADGQSESSMMMQVRWGKAHAGMLFAAAAAVAVAVAVAITTTTTTTITAITTAVAAPLKRHGRLLSPSLNE